MGLTAVVLLSALWLGIWYFVYGRFLARRFGLDPNRAVPSEELRDGRDFEPAAPGYLLGQHFSAIAAAGPIVGPVLAGVLFGWAPALAWILIGSVLIGGVHDFGSLVASLRHRAASIAEVVREHMSRRSYLLFLSFIWIALVYIIVAFTDVTARAFVGTQTLEGGATVHGGGIATSSLLYLLIPMAMGVALRRKLATLPVLTALALPLIGLAIWGGQSLPLDFPLDASAAVKAWGLIILLYCVLAAAAPMWLILQPRGHLGGYFLYGAIFAGVVGVLFSGKGIQYPAFVGWENVRGETLAPFLFITIACGACSGFHSLISSGTTSKQLRSEVDARPVAYGSMLLEAFVAVLALTTVMILVPGSPITQSPQPNLIYAQGIGGYLQTFGLPAALAVSFALMAFTTFVYDTLDVCTRLGRYIVQELTGLKDRRGVVLGTGLTAGIPLLALLTDQGTTPAWRTYWGLFGASNQLLAALALLGVTVWLWRTRREAWIWPCVALPCAFMTLMSSWALVELIRKGTGPVPVAGTVLLALAVLMVLEGVASLRKPPLLLDPVGA